MAGYINASSTGFKGSVSPSLGREPPLAQGGELRPIREGRENLRAPRTSAIYPSALGRNRVRWTGRGRAPRRVDRCRITFASFVGSNQRGHSDHPAQQRGGIARFVPVTTTRPHAATSDRLAPLTPFHRASGSNDGGVEPPRPLILPLRVALTCREGLGAVSRQG